MDLWKMHAHDSQYRLLPLIVTGSLFWFELFSCHIVMISYFDAALLSARTPFFANNWLVPFAASMPYSQKYRNIVQRFLTIISLLKQDKCMWDTFHVCHYIINLLNVYFNFSNVLSIAFCTHGVGQKILRPYFPTSCGSDSFIFYLNRCFVNKGISLEYRTSLDSS